MLLDIINPSNGSFEWFNNTPSHKNRRNIGSILESPAFYPYLSAVQNLKIVADIKETGYDDINECIEKVGLSSRKHSQYKTYSFGMKQRLAIAASLLGNPKVLILDEPTNGLDPEGIAEIRELIKSIARDGKTVLLASYLLDEVQKVCTHFAVLNKGQLLHIGQVGDVLFDITTIEVAASDNDALKKVLLKFTSDENIKYENSKFLVQLPKNKSIEELSKHVTSNNLTLTHLLTQQKSLEEQFLEILKESE